MGEGKAKVVKIYKTPSKDGSIGPVAQPGWSARLITGRSWVQIPPGPIKSEHVT